MYIIRHCNYSMLSGLESGYMAILGKGEENKGEGLTMLAWVPYFCWFSLEENPRVLFDVLKRCYACCSEVYISRPADKYFLFKSSIIWDAA